MSIPNQVAVPYKSPAAHIALVILASRMGANVNGELCFTGECHGAPVAAERLLRHVRPSNPKKGSEINYIFITW